MVSPLRAMAIARLQLLWNTAHRGQGLLGLLAAIALVVVGLLILVPPFFMFAYFGNLLGGELAAESSPALVWVSSLHALLVFGLGAAGGLRQQRGFDRELLRMHPLRPLQLLVAELPFGLLDTIPALATSLFLGLGTGLARSLPGLWLPVVLVIGQGILGVLLVQQLVAVIRRLAGHRRVLLLGLGLLAVPLLGFGWLALQHGALTALSSVMSRLPTTLGHHGLRALALEDGGRGALFLAGSVAFTLALVAVTTWLQLRELKLDPPLQVATGTKEVLWSFEKPAAGIGRLFSGQVLGSRFGQLLMFTPVFLSVLFVLASSILERSAQGRDETGFQLTMGMLFEKIQALPLWLVVPPAVVCMGAEIWLNQFSWDGNGLKTLLLAPIRTGDVLLGKIFGLFRLQLPLGLVACLPLLRLGMPDPFEVLTGLTAASAFIVTLGTTGHLLSAHFPRRQRGSGEGAGSTPPLLILTSTALILALAAVSFAIVQVAGGLAPWAPAVVFAVLTIVGLLTHRALRPSLASFVDERRELMVETLG